MKYRSKKISSILSGSQHLKSLLQVSRQQQQILNIIKQLLETQLAAHCISAHYSRQCLKLFTDSSVWASRLRFQTKSLARQLTENNLPTHKIDVRVIPKSVSGTPVVRKRTANRVSEKTAESIIQTAESINDEKLEAALKKLARSVTRKEPY
jgi:hypothetical protein